MKNIYISTSVRTAIGKLGGTMRTVQAEDLAKIVIEAVLANSGIDPSAIDEVVLGQGKQSSDAPNIARVSALMSGIPVEVPAFTVMRQCGSGMQAIHSAAQEIGCGLAEIALAGGTESMSCAPYYLRQARYGYNVGNSELIDPNTESQPRSQPISMFGSFNMGITAENIADKYMIAREDQDAFAYQSQCRAAKSISDGIFKEEIVPVSIPQRKKDPIIFDTDESPRLSPPEVLAKLRPVFKTDGSVTAGNTCGRSDGAAAMLLFSDEAKQKHGLKPTVRIVAQANAGVSPLYMGLGPIAATQKALKSASLNIKDIGLVELNEAFAAQSIACLRELGIDQTITNVNGGAIAIGHPIGSTGARIVTTLLHEMTRRKVRYGLATLCIAGGLGSALILERV